MKTAAPPRFIRVTKTLRPGQPGTLKLTRRYGESLFCVRYREDAIGHRRCTTVELVIEEGPVQRRVSDRRIVQVKIPWDDRELRLRAQQLHARWDPKSRTWQMSMRTARSLGLASHLVTDHMPIDGKVG